MRKRIFEIIEVGEPGDKISQLYDWFMMLCIIVSIVPLFFHETNNVFYWMDKVTFVIFVIDYILRFITSDFKLNKGGLSFLFYPITPMAIIDIVSILPSVSIVSNGFKLARFLRLFRTFRVLKTFKIIRYSKAINMILNVINRQKKLIGTVGILAVGYVIICALIIFNVEPDSFENFFEAIYWATVSLTTMGYGDIYPVTTIGRIVTMISSVFGIAIVALPAGIITAGFTEEIQEENEKKKRTEETEKITTEENKEQ